MKCLALPLSVCSLYVFATVAVAQQTAKVEVTFKIRAKTPSFTDKRVVVMLYHDYPLQGDRGLKAVDRHIDAKFSHHQGIETTVTVTLGEKATLNRSVQYSVNVMVFDRSKATHFGEMNGERGPFNVLTNGAPSKIAVIVRPEP